MVPESNRIYGNAVRAYLSQLDAFEQYPSGARPADLARITWTNLEAGYIRPYGGITRFGRARLFPSDYFPDFIDDDGRECKLTPDDFLIEGALW